MRYGFHLPARQYLNGLPFPAVLGVWFGVAVLGMVAIPAPAAGGPAAVARTTAMPEGFKSIGVAKAPFQRYQQQVGMARDGRAVVSWSGGRGIVARSLSASGVPGDLQTIPPFSGPYWRNFARMAVGEAGDSVFVGGLNSQRTFVRTRSFGGDLGATLSLSAGGSSSGISHQAGTVDGTGRALVVKSRGRCCSKDSLASVVAYRVAPDGMLLATLPLYERRVEYPVDGRYTSAEVYDARIDGKGDTVVLWELNSGNSAEQGVLFLQRVAASGEVGPPIEVARESYSDPRLAVAEDGWSTLLWRVGQRGIDARMVSPAGTPSPHWTLSRQANASEGWGSLAALGRGTSVAGWTEGRGRRSWTVARVLTPRGPGARSTLSGRPRRAYIEMGTSAAGPGAALVVWSGFERMPDSRRDIRYSVRARLVRRGGHIGPLETLTPLARAGCRGAQAAGNGRGKAIVVCAKPAFPSGGPAQVLVRHLRIP